MTDAILSFTAAHHLHVGDRVIMRMDQEAREWGRKGPKDGTQGTIIGKYRSRRFKPRFGQIGQVVEPGIYEEDADPIVHWDGFDPDPTVKDGYSRDSTDVALEDVPGFKGTAEELEKIMSFSRTRCHDMVMLDQVESERRYRENWVIPVHRDQTVSSRDQEDMLLNVKRIGDLPNTMAWEGDIITPNREGLLKAGLDPDRAVHIRVHSIMYEWVTIEPHTYLVSWHYDDTGEDTGMGSTYIGDKDIKAVERGNIWKHYHGEPVTFRSIEEEVSFAHSMGMSEEVRNPEKNLYSWTLYEALDAIENNLGQGFTHGLSFGPSSRISLYRFNDEDLAERLREKVLTEFRGPDCLGPSL